MDQLLQQAEGVGNTADLESLLTQFGTSEWFEQHSFEGYNSKNVDKVLQKILDNEEIVTNAKIKRRLKRFIETIDGKLAANIPSSSTNQYAGAGTLTLDEIVQSISTSHNIKEIQYCINSIQINEVMQNDGDKLKLKNTLLDLLQYKEQYTNKLLRKRVSKLVYSLSSKDDQTKIKIDKKTKQEATPVSTQVVGNKRKIGNTTSLSIPAVPAPVLKHVEVDPNITYTSFSDLVKLLENAKEVTDIEDSLKNVSVIASGGQDDYASQQQIIDLFRSSNSCIASIVMNSKLRRKVDRLVETLQENVKKNEQYSKQKKAKLTVTKIVEKPVANAVTIDEDKITEVIDKLKSSTTAVDIDDALSLLPNFADGHIQSAPLKECIEHILATKEEILNSKSKRMLKRKLSAMGGESTAVDAVPEPKRAKKADPAPVMTPEELKKTPYIVFIGQLTYDTTADDVTNFLRSSGIEGPLQVRMLTDKTTGQSKGQCFVTLEGSREMNKCIALHQSLLNNRRINIEKSVGGKNKDARTVKLRETRLQLKIRHSEQIDAIIATHTRNSNLAPITSDFLLNKLYRLTAIEVDKILKKFTEMPNTMRKMTVLDKIVSDLLVSNKKV